MLDLSPHRRFTSASEGTAIFRGPGWRQPRHPGPPTQRIRNAASILFLLVIVGACGSPVTPSPSPTKLHVAGESANGATVHLRQGDRLEVSLHSTYWAFNGSSNTRVLVAEGPAVITPSPGQCVPGGGCGTVEMTFDVVGIGLADVTASRTSCGEALLCTGSQGSYKLTVMATA